MLDGKKKYILKKYTILQKKEIFYKVTLSLKISHLKCEKYNFSVIYYLTTNNKPFWLKLNVISFTSFIIENSDIN